MIYRFLSDCDRTEAAKDLVSSLYFVLLRTDDAKPSISALVWLPVCVCDRADPANRLAIRDALSSLSVRAASCARPSDVCLLFMLLTF